MLSQYYSEPAPEDFLGCPFGGNPKVASQFGFPACGTAIPGGSGLASLKGGRKSRRGGRKSRRGGQEPAGEPAAPHSGVPVAPHDDPAASADVKPSAPKQQCPQECIAKGCAKPNFLHKIFGMSGGRKSRRRRKAHKAHKSRKPHKSRKSRKSRKARKSRKSRH